ncbi:hypothetical protein GIB67_021470 [Kingdonia uniflora]|uniref:Uncharacterized protein n=1 Tax=Kingdonia uniflora TaxID=39325 RepID=A0A7J7L9N6_9MAGN|nr:hypothetical protein GIB67_021470 [Kingdonia uniflora]
MRSENLKPNSKVIVSSISEGSSTSGRSVENSEVRGTVVAEVPVVAHFVVEERMEIGGENVTFFKYPDNIDVGKKFSKYKKDLAGKWGDYVINSGGNECSTVLSYPTEWNVFDDLDSFDTTNGLAQAPTKPKPIKKKPASTSYKQHMKPVKKKDRSWRVGNDGGDGMPVVRVFQKPVNMGLVKARV